MRKIGKKFKYKNVILLTVEQPFCGNCYFNPIDESEDCINPRFHCNISERYDKKSVAFILVPFKFGR